MADHHIPAIVQTISGHMVNLLDPQAADITLHDIAHHLSRIPRFNGATIGRYPWSIADHSLLVEDLVSLVNPDPLWRMAALLHDAHEFVVGDITRPMQSALWTIQGPRASVDAFAFIKRILQNRIHERFGMPPTDTWPVAMRDTIKLCDNQALNHERQSLLVATPDEHWNYLPTVPENAPVLWISEPILSAQRFAQRVMWLWLRMHDYPDDNMLEFLRAPWPDEKL